VTKIRTVFS